MYKTRFRVILKNGSFLDKDFGLLFSDDYFIFFAICGHLCKGVNKYCCRCTNGDCDYCKICEEALKDKNA